MTKQTGKMSYIESDISMQYESEDDSFDVENVAPPKKGLKPAPKAKVNNKKVTTAVTSVLSPSKNAGNIPATSEAEKSIEQMYQKKTQLEHILIRPDTYIGSVEPLTQHMFVWDKNTKKVINRQITYTPGLYKIYDESKYNLNDHDALSFNLLNQNCLLFRLRSFGECCRQQAA